MLETYTSDPLTVEKMKEDKRKKMNEYKPETGNYDDFFDISKKKSLF